MLSRLPLLDRISKIGSDEMNYFVQSVIKSFQIVSGSSTTNEKGNAKRTIHYNHLCYKFKVDD